MDEVNPEIIKTEETKKTKICGKCKTEKDLEEEFSKRKTGYSDWCKACHKSYSKEHYVKNLDKKNAQVREWQKANPEKVKGHQKNYRTKQTKKVEIEINNMLSRAGYPTR